MPLRHRPGGHAESRAHDGMQHGVHGRLVSVLRRVVPHPGPCSILPDLHNSTQSHTARRQQQIYKSPALAPGGWGLQGCFVNTPLLPAFSAAVHTTFASNVDLVDQCISYCTRIGMPFAGVENASDCQCSLGLTAGVTGVPESECNATCPVPPGEGSLFCGGVERLMVYRYQG